MTLQEWAEGQRDACLQDAFDFLRMKGLCDVPADLTTLDAEWERHQEKFDPGTPEQFYLQWQGRMGASAICRNAIDQFLRQPLLKALGFVFPPPSAFGGRVLDYGCGTAALSLAWHRAFIPRARLYLADVANLSQEFVQYRVDGHGDTNVRVLGVYLADVPDSSVDVILCIDVLEHLVNPSETFRMLDRKLRGGGITIIQAPWGGHVEHLDEAPVDWEENGGRELFEKQYACVLKTDPVCPVAGVYWKRLSS